MPFKCPDFAKCVRLYFGVLAVILGFWSTAYFNLDKKIDTIYKMIIDQNNIIQAKLNASR